MANTKVDMNYIQNCVYTKQQDITNLCNDLETNLSSEFTNYANIIRQAEDACNKEALSVNEMTLQSKFEEIANEIDRMNSTILEYTSQIRNNLPGTAAYQKSRIDAYYEEAKKISEQAK